MCTSFALLEMVVVPRRFDVMGQWYIGGHRNIDTGLDKRGTTPTTRNILEVQMGVWGSRGGVKLTPVE